jgi:hypothetical protein
VGVVVLESSLPIITNDDANNATNISNSAWNSNAQMQMSILVVKRGPDIPSSMTELWDFCLLTEFRIKITKTKWIYLLSKSLV